MLEKLKVKFVHVILFPIPYYLLPIPILNSLSPISYPVFWLLPIPKGALEMQMFVCHSVILSV